MSEISVELRPHKGIIGTKIGPTEVTLPQKIIFVNGVQAGYVGDAEGASISLILSNLTPEQVKEITRQVNELKGSPASFVSQAKALRDEDADPAAINKAKEGLSDLGL